MASQDRENSGKESGIEAISEERNSVEFSTSIPWNSWGSSAMRKAINPIMTCFSKMKAHPLSWTTVLLSRKQQKSPAVFQFMLLLVEHEGELMFERKKIYKILKGRGWRQSAQAKCKKTGCTNVPGNNLSSCPTIVPRIKSQGLQMNNKVMMPQVLKSKCIIFQQCFEVSDSDFSNCMSEPLQIEFDVTFPVCETVSLIYKEDPLTYSERFFNHMGVVNPHNLSLLLKIERREQEPVLKDFWDDYNKQHKRIISSWMRMSEEHDSFVLHELFQQLQPLDFVSRRGQKHVKRLQELQNDQIDNEIFINKIKLILIDCLVEIGEYHDNIHKYVSLPHLCTRKLKEKGIIEENIEKDLEEMLKKETKFTRDSLCRIAQAVNRIFTNENTEFELNGMQGLTEDEFKSYMKALEEICESKDGIRMLAEFVEILTTLCLKNRDFLGYSEDEIYKYQRRANLEDLLVILEGFFTGFSGTKLRERIEQLAEMHFEVLKSKRADDFFLEDTALLLHEFLLFSKFNHCRFVQFHLQGVDKASVKSNSVGYDKSSNIYHEAFEIKLGLNVELEEIKPTVRVFEGQIKEYGVLGGELILPADSACRPSKLKRVHSNIEVLEQKETKEIIVRSTNIKILERIRADICCGAQKDIRLYHVSLVLRPEYRNCETTAYLTLICGADLEQETKLELHHDEHFQIKYNRPLDSIDQPDHSPAKKTWSVSSSFGSLQGVHTRTSPEQMRRAASARCRRTNMYGEFSEVRNKCVRTRSVDTTICATCGSAQTGLNVICNTTIFANGENVVNSVGDGFNLTIQDCPKNQLT